MTDSQKLRTLGPGSWWTPNPTDAPVWVLIEDWKRVKPYLDGFVLV